MRASLSRASTTSARGATVREAGANPSRARRRVRARARRNLNLPEILPDELSGALFASKDLWNTSIRGVILRRCESAREATHWLQYMPMRNRAELARLMLEYAETPYCFEVVGYREWADVKPTTTFGKTPSLVDVDGRGNDLSHEMAIVRYLADALGLAGGDAFERAKCDELFSQWWCTCRNFGLTHDGEQYSARELQFVTDADVQCPRYQETHRVNDLSVASRSVQALRVFEEILQANGTGYLIGDAMTFVDLALFETLFELAEPEHVPDFAERLELPRCGEFLERVSRVDSIAAYIASPTRVPRYERPSYAYIGARSTIPK